MRLQLRGSDGEKRNPDGEKLSGFVVLLNFTYCGNCGKLYFCGMIGFKLTFVKRYFQSQLVQKFSEREAEQLLRILFEDLFGLDRMKILMTPTLSIDEFQYHQMEMAVADLLNDKPIQYVTGMAEFCDLKFKVDESVLIPRPETEEMVRKIVAQDIHPKRIWDVGTGSGCIAVSLAKRFPMPKSLLSMSRKRRFWLPKAMPY